MVYQRVLLMVLLQFKSLVLQTELNSLLNNINKKDLLERAGLFCYNKNK
jgi:hypothetical protein